MQKNIIKLVLIIPLLLIHIGCGYHFPAVAIYEGPEKTLYMPQWQNRTSRLDINVNLYKTLTGKFQRSQAITIVRDKAQADLMLAGEVFAIELPGIAWDADTVTTDAMVRLTVRYMLKDLKTGKPLWKVPEQLWTKEYHSGTKGTAAENQAIATIINDLANHIYINTLRILNEEGTGDREQGTVR